jgi:SpoVK/Ycf46/Vps4 family AAA+-type ATPase
VLREAYYDLRNGEKTIFITAPEIAIPEPLKKEILVLEMSLPDENEQLRLVHGFCQSYSVQLDEALLSDMAFGLKGLSVNEATHTLNRIFRSKAFEREQLLEEIFKDKEMVVKKAGYLEYVRPQQGIEDIGGLENLKDWLVRRRHLFGRQALADGLPIPKGMLVMGMSGCGKSLAAKAVAHLWGLALFRLDMNLVNSGIFGKPEAAFHRALRTVEALAPAVLWIDEIENSLGMDSDSGAGNAGIFSSFLTWMQEKPPLIFVAATANRIQALPAEVIRKGRFDQVFFVDLPSPEERKQIFGIHLQRNHADVAAFDLEILAMATKAWNGAEIEQVVASARVDAYSEGRTLTMGDLTRSTSQTVPLSKTMHEQMKAIRGWAFGRATLASKDKYAEA